MRMNRRYRSINVTAEQYYQLEEIRAALLNNSAISYAPSVQWLARTLLNKAIDEHGESITRADVATAYQTN
ncbi:TPA: hypothetical protein ACNADN_005228 [Klebsiella pneumoniae]